MLSNLICFYQNREDAFVQCVNMLFNYKLHKNPILLAIVTEEIFQLIFKERREVEKIMEVRQRSHHCMKEK